MKSFFSGLSRWRRSCPISRNFGKIHFGKFLAWLCTELFWSAISFRLFLNTPSCFFLVHQRWIPLNRGLNQGPTSAIDAFEYWRVTRLPLIKFLTSRCLVLNVTFHIFLGKMISLIFLVQPQTGKGCNPKGGLSVTLRCSHWGMSHWCSMGQGAISVSSFQNECTAEILKVYQPWYSKLCISTPKWMIENWKLKKMIEVSVLHTLMFCSEWFGTQLRFISNKNRYVPPPGCNSHF